MSAEDILKDGIPAKDFQPEVKVFSLAHVRAAIAAARRESRQTTGVVDLANESDCCWCREGIPHTAEEHAWAILPSH